MGIFAFNCWYWGPTWLDASYEPWPFDETEHNAHTDWTSPNHGCRIDSWVWPIDERMYF